MESLGRKVSLLTILLLSFVPCCFSETRSAQDMAKDAVSLLTFFKGTSSIPTRTRFLVESVSVIFRVLETFPLDGRECEVV